MPREFGPGENSLPLPSSPGPNSPGMLSLYLADFYSCQPLPEACPRTPGLVTGLLQGRRPAGPVTGAPAESARRHQPADDASFPRAARSADGKLRRAFVAPEKCFANTSLPYARATRGPCLGCRDSRLHRALDRLCYIGGPARGSPDNALR
ncbi:hypothetical protein Bbelb_167020 [Branchiostoma belcheri]|nr:hypothetical protein Bbelb_167020 [Branchiostoma belcheri]